MTLADWQLLHKKYASAGWQLQNSSEKNIELGCCDKSR
jgi:hypothetical protein